MMITNSRKKLTIIFLTLFVMGSMLLGCEGKASSPQQPLSILGDIENPLSLNCLADAPVTLKLEHKEQTIQVASLAELIEEAEPWGDQYEVLFIAGDGFSALITNEDLTESYLTLNAKNGWEAINLKHPVSSNIKNIQDIVIVAQDMSIDKYFNIIEPGRDITRLSVGELYKGGYSVFSTVRGRSTVDNEGQVLAATTYYRHKAFAIEDYVNLTGKDSVLVVGERGEMEPLRQDGRFILEKNSIGYMTGDELVLSRAKGIVLDPPAKRITDVYHDSKAAMAAGDQILVILMDGFGYHQYEYARDHGYIPFLASLPAPVLSMSVFPSITPVNLAASLSGALPHVNGVYERRSRQLEVPTLFALAKEEGKGMAAVFGPLGTIELEIPPVFNVDRNNNDSSDDEKTEYTLGIIGEHHDLLFVHYKDVDVTGHDNGDLHEKTLAVIRETDEYIRQLVAHWQGKVLIYADHGMYATDTGGTHGTLSSKSMFTPYWLFDTGN